MNLILQLYTLFEKDNNKNYLISCSSDKSIKMYCMEENNIVKTYNKKAFINTRKKNIYTYNQIL